jgi:hypothetical protein
MISLLVLSLSHRLLWRDSSVEHQVPKYVSGHCSGKYLNIFRYLGTPQVVPGFVSDSLLYLGIPLLEFYALKYTNTN